MKILLHENLQGVNTSSFISDLKRCMFENLKDLNRQSNNPKFDSDLLISERSSSKANVSAQFDDIKIRIEVSTDLTSSGSYEELRTQLLDNQWINTWLKNACSKLFEYVEMYAKASKDALQKSNTPAGLTTITFYSNLHHGVWDSTKNPIDDRIKLGQIFVDVQIPGEPSIIHASYFGPEISGDFFKNEFKLNPLFYPIEEFIDDIVKDLQISSENIKTQKTRKRQPQLNLTNDQLSEIWTALGEVISDNPWYSSTLNDAGTESDDPEVQEMIDLQDKIDLAIDRGKKLAQKDIRRALEICQDNGREFDFAE